MQELATALIADLQTLKAVLICFFSGEEKMDVWDYYHRCLAYPATRPDKRGQENVIVSKSRRLSDELGLVFIHPLSHLKRIEKNAAGIQGG